MTVAKKNRLVPVDLKNPIYLGTGSPATFEALYQRERQLDIYDSIRRMLNYLDRGRLIIFTPTELKAIAEVKQELAGGVTGVITMSDQGALATIIWRTRLAIGV